MAGEAIWFQRNERKKLLKDEGFSEVKSYKTFRCQYAVDLYFINIINCWFVNNK